MEERQRIVNRKIEQQKPEEILKEIEAKLSDGSYSEAFLHSLDNLNVGSLYLEVSPDGKSANVRDRKDKSIVFFTEKEEWVRALEKTADMRRKSFDS